MTAFQTSCNNCSVVLHIRGLLLWPQYGAPVNMGMMTVKGADMNRDGDPNVLQQPQIGIASSQVCVSDQDECDVTAMSFPIPAETHSIPSHGIATGRKGETGCGVRSSRDGLTADIVCDGTHCNFPVTLESGEAIEDVTKDEVEHLMVMLREVVDVLYRRQEGELLSHGRYYD